MLSTACTSSRRASARRRLGVLAELPPLARLRRRPRVAVRLAEQHQRLLDELPGKLHVGVPLDEQVERVVAQLRQHAGRVPQPHGPLAEGQQPLEDVVHGQVARGAGQHPAAPANRLPDDLHHDPRLAGAGRAVDQAHVAGGEGKLHRLPLHGVETGVQRPDFGVHAELRLPHAYQHVAQDGKAVAAGRAGCSQGDPLPLDGHLVERHVQPPGLVVGQVLGQPFQGHADRRFAALADDAPWDCSTLAALGERTTGLPTSSRVQGKRRTAAAAKLHEVSAAQPRLFVDHHQVHQGVARLLGLCGREPPGLLGRPLGLGAAFQVQQPPQPLEVVLLAAAILRMLALPAGRWSTPAPGGLAQRLAVQEP